MNTALHLAPKSTFTITISTDPEMTKRFGRKVKKLGGKYDHARGGYNYRRGVTLPINDDGFALGQTLLKEFPNYKGADVRVNESFFGMRMHSASTFFHVKAEDADSISKAIETYKTSREEYLRKNPNAVAEALASALRRIGRPEIARDDLVRSLASLRVKATKLGVDFDTVVAESATAEPSEFRFVSI